MGDFRSALMGKLAEAAKDKYDPNRGPHDRSMPSRNFRNEQIVDLEKYKDLLFKLFMLRARIKMIRTNQDALPENQRVVTVSVELTFRTSKFHAPAPQAAALGFLGTIPDVASSGWDDPDSVETIGEMNAIQLACDDN